MLVKHDLIEFLVRSGALTFGEFTLKSGRKSPYFMNTGRFDDGAKIAELSSHYAAHLAQRSNEFTVIFGPAYKGIPLAVSTALSLSKNHHITKPFSFNRKEAKTHGDTGMLVGHTLTSEDTVAIVEDVITAGTTLREIVPLLKDTYKASIYSVTILLDRGERGLSTRSALQESSEELGILIEPLLTVHDVVDFARTSRGSALGLGESVAKKIEAYLEEYGA